MRRDALRSRDFLSIAVAAGALAMALAAPRASAQQRAKLTRKERPLASLPFDSADARGVVVSPDGTRGAYAKRIKGGLQLVVIDGNVGEQPYDQIGPNVVTFGPDSRRTAYAGRRGGQWYAVVDGEEGEPFDFVAGDSIVFSPDGLHVAYVAERNGKQLVVADGTAGAPFDAVSEGSPTFSADGQRFACVARAGGKEFVVVNGNPGTPYDSVGRPRFSRDGQHLAFAASAGGNSFVVLDGNVRKGYAGGEGVHPLSLTFGPNGQRLAYVVGPAGNMRAVIDGAEGKRYAHVFDNSIAFSPDGTRVGYVAKRAEAGRAGATAPAAVVVLDAKEGRPHQAVVPGSLRFSPDGRRFAYLAERSGADGVVRRVAVVDGKEGRLYEWVRDAPVFSPDGRHYAYVAQRRRQIGGAAGAAAQQPAEAERLPPGQWESSRLPPRRPAAAPFAPNPFPPDPPAATGASPELPGLGVTSYECFAVVDGVEAAPYPWVRGDLRFTLDGSRLAYVAAAPDDRFLDAGEIPADPANPSAGNRLVFETPKGDRSYSPGRVTQPVKLLMVEERVELE